MCWSAWWCPIVSLGSVHFSSRERSGTPLQYSCLENPTDRGAWYAAVRGVAKSWTRLSGFTFTFHFHALEKEMATHSSVLAWRIPGTEEPDGLPSMGSHRVGHDWSDLAAAAAAFFFFFLSAPQTRKFQMFDLQICLSFILPAQICCWLPVVSFLFQVLLLFSSKICLVSFINFYLFIDILCSYIVILIFFSSLSIISFS